jgi:hypothetical protein
VHAFYNKKKRTRRGREGTGERGEGGKGEKEGGRERRTPEGLRRT